MLDLLIAHPWIVAVLWAGLYIFDYASTLWLAGAYKTTLSQYMVYEGGVELNPSLEKRIARRQGPGPGQITQAALVVILVFLSGLLGPYFVEFIAGALLLTWIFVDARHLRNYAYAWFLRRKPGSLKGRSEYSYWLLQKTLSAEAFTYTVLYLIFALLTLRLFFLAGALTCLSFTLRQSRLADRKLPTDLNS